MRIMIAGGTGFIGQNLIAYFKPKGYEVSVIGRSKDHIQQEFGDQVAGYTWDDVQQSGLAMLKSVDAVINLTGASLVEQRWTYERKKVLYDSRVRYTQILADICAALGNDAPVLINASGAGIYGLQAGIKGSMPKAFDETSVVDYENPKSFVAKINSAREKATIPAKNAGVRVVLLRISGVLAKSGGPLEKLKTLYKLGLGAVMGDGNQPFSWISINDFCRAMDFILHHPEIDGPVNMASINATTQKDFAAAFAKSLNRPRFLRIPSFIAKALYGQMAEEVLLSGQNVIPKKLLDAGFEFHDKKLDQVL